MTPPEVLRVLRRVVCYSLVMALLWVLWTTTPASESRPQCEIEDCSGHLVVVTTAPGASF